MDSLNNLLAFKEDTSRVNIWSEIVFGFIKQKDLVSADSVYEKAINYVKEKNLEVPYSLKWAHAEILFYQKEGEAALTEMKTVIDQIQESGNTRNLTKALNFLAFVYLNTGKYHDCIETFTKSIDFAKNNSIASSLPESYSGLAYAYRYIGNVEEQRKNLILMADISTKENYIRYAADAYLRLGDIGMELDSNFTYAIQHYHTCLQLRKQLNDSASIAFTLLRLGWNHYLNKELDSALNYFFHSLEYSIPINRLTSITNAYGNIGTIYRDKKEFDKAIKYYRESIDYSLKASDWYNLSWLYKDISDMDKNQGNYKSAYENFVLHKQFSDSVEMTKYSKGLSDARTRYEAEKKEKDLELLKLKLEKQKYFTYGFAGTIILVLIIGIMLFYQNRMNAKRKISEMNHKISEITQKNLRQQMNPHFIFNTLNSIQYYMYQHDKISTNNYLTKFSSLMRKTLENSQHTSIPIKDEMDALELYLQLESIRFKEKFDYKITIDEDIDTLLYKIPTMLIQPYVENAICHGLINKDEKGFLNIDLKLQQDFISCTIEDNGIGREAALEIKKVKNGNHQSLGTKITESRLNLVNALYGNSMKIDYTDIKDNEGKPNGTRVVIYIPIMT
jgi:tetratricopeptide (TPR) repeat protein